MIMRIWHGVTEENLSESYYQYIMDTGVPMYQAQDGFRGVYLLKKVNE